MNIPLDRLYHYIANIAQEIYSDRIVIYRFWPHGSKNINDLNNLYSTDGWVEKTIYPNIWCNDQEPLDYDFYKINLKTNEPKTHDDILLNRVLRSPKNLNYRFTIFKKGLLLHSEKRSTNIEKYYNDDELIPVYYWSHAIIARDWFRYGQHVTQQKKSKKTFLIYSRSWSNTREYRLRFAELLIHLNLQQHCKTSINPIEPELGIHYDSHQFKNSVWRPQTVLENFFSTTSAHSGSSADFDIEDYEATDIEVVLETLFDDDRLHLTEKSLRPIALGQPFILAGTQGSLEYLRSYGFKTFGDIWDESYDLVEDPAERLIQIADLMRQIENWGAVMQERKLAEARTIADYNRQHFFSQEFFDLVVDELKVNLASAFKELESCNNYTNWLNLWGEITNYPEFIKFLENDHGPQRPTRSTVDLVMELAQRKLAEKNTE